MCYLIEYIDIATSEKWFIIRTNTFQWRHSGVGIIIKDRLCYSTNLDVRSTSRKLRFLASFKISGFSRITSLRSSTILRLFSWNFSFSLRYSMPKLVLLKILSEYFLGSNTRPIVISESLKEGSFRENSVLFIRNLAKT